jgi:hypothetical protein
LENAYFVVFFRWQQRYRGLRMARRSCSRLAAVRASEDVQRMLAFHHVPLSYDGPTAIEITRKHAEILSPSLFHYSNPISVLSRSLSRPEPLSDKIE